MILPESKSNDRYNCPWISTGDQHCIQNIPSHSSVTFHVWMYINKYKIKYTNGGFSSTITIAEEVVQITNEGQDSETITSYF